MFSARYPVSPYSSTRTSKPSNNRGKRGLIFHEIIKVGQRIFRSPGDESLLVSASLAAYGCLFRSMQLRLRQKASQAAWSKVFFGVHAAVRNVCKVVFLEQKTT
jgi:hypothetical protein